ncbi:hypothetical protein AGLY_013616 [Aphis glycines]|uniref:Uncharacterized protein n=1 Tax=Aphis glycines TaxID=307491 RepID=A0A6G0T6T8_APHGL|nr:hypothetical protein AGLY_013616 [Aphis glycines]
MMLRVFSIATSRKTYRKLSVVFLILSYKHKTFNDFLISKLLANFRVFDRFPTIRTTHKEPCIKFSSFFGHPKIFYRHFKKKFSKKSKISVIPLILTFGENFKMICQPGIYFPVGGEKCGLCFNDLKFKFFYNCCKPNLTFLKISEHFSYNDASSFLYSCLKKSYGKLSVEFFNLGYKYKHFYEFSIIQLLITFCEHFNYLYRLVFELQLYKINRFCRMLVLCKNSHFPSLLFVFSQFF